ncbi:tetratricopeptide repeat protein [Luteolibacter ambystomatis]|uniref:Tetratricopeptide repeat protein n=1 Tax=Luteolibacter ambystomatis TaxID=2824561 RepID=A0A975G9I5_9BACT|nr:tetratricopeptide repeat protein [Luteolibacter ambystomatis]QUE51200.1 tetratricopeptide repeat protein [Luteolibacter ambystomatis]
MKRPHNAALFDRFFGAWIDEQPVESLGVFLTDRAEKNGGQDWTVLALYQLRRGQEDGALASLGKAIAAVPDDPALAMDRAKLRLRRMEFDSARKDLAAVVAGKDEALALEASKLLGKSWLREGKAEEAIKAWDAVLAAHPGDEDLLEDLVETAAAEGETAQALTYVGKLIEVSKDPYQKTLRGLRRGDLLAHSGKNDEAVEAYAATLAQVGEGSWLEREVLAQIEKVFRKQDRLDELAAQLAKLAEANPRRLLIHRQLAKLEAAQGDADKAIGRFREVLKRSPGDRELREEFVRLLTDGERFDDASAELEKLIETAPTESGLYLQLASLRSRQGKPEAVLTALKKAHELMGKDEGAGIRIAGLMLQYNQNEPGEALLKELSAAPGAGPAPAEVLAAQYGRTNRKTEALDLLKKVGVSDDVDVVIRVAGAISALGESATAYDVLVAKAEKFPSEPRFLIALSQTALAAGKAEGAVPQAVKLVRLAKQSTELAESIGLAGRVIAAADKGLEWRKTLEAQAARSPSETCLLASLAETQGDLPAVGKLLDAATDPLVVHFHAALLDRRGDFDTAIAVLSRLADTDEGRKAAYFKDLAELQQRAGKAADAIATVERWKQSAPGDKTAWTMASRLLRESGKADEAVKVARQAAARFEGDADLAAALALLHDEAGQWADAEAIYWRLYDESQSPTDQARWAAQLAQLALKNGRTEELDEKLKERAKGNRRSLGPILAQAELARVMQNEDKRRDLLLEAVRIQPKDVDLRLQISALEDKAGNQDRVVAVLEEALPYDNANKVRSALAQAYLRQGQALKGLREMRAMSGKKAGDPRSTEESAAALAGSKMHDEAIRFMREEIPDGGDWRSKYLLAVLLEEDGRETEALPIFISLMQAEGDLPSAKPATPNPQQVRNNYEAYGEDVQKLMELSGASQAAYTHKRPGNSYGHMLSRGSGMTGSFRLPDTSEEVRSYSLVHLCKLAKRGGGGLDPSVAALIKAAGVSNIEFASEFFEQQSNGNPDFARLMEKFPDQPGLMELAGMYGRGVTVAVARKVLEKGDKVSPLSRVNACIRILSEAGDKPEDKTWDALIDAARAAGDVKSGPMRSMIGYQVLSLLTPKDPRNGSQNNTVTVPDSKKEPLKKLVVETLVEKQEQDMDSLHLRLGALSVAGTTEQWIDALNKGIKDFRNQPPNKKAGQMMGGRSAYSRILQYGRYSSGYNPWESNNPFELPKAETCPLGSIPPLIFSQFKMPSADTNNYYGSYGRGVEIAEAMKSLDRFESPVLRVWIATLSGDDAAIAKSLSASPPKEEAADFEVFRALQLIKQKKMADAYATLEKARTLGAADRDFAMWVNVSMVAVAGEIPAEERAGISDSLQAALMQCRQSFGPMAAAVVAGQATKLGLADLAKRLQPPPGGGGTSGRSVIGPAGFAARSSSSSSSSGGVTASVQRMTKFVSEKKYETAAREALQILRNQRSNPYGYSGEELQNLKQQLGEEGSKELMKLVDPGESKSLVKRLEYADVCGRLGMKDAMVATLEKLHEERPDDVSVAARLAFSLPLEKKDERLKLMSAAAGNDEFVSMAIESANALGRNSSTDGKASVDFQESVTAWLEQTDPKTLEKANLTWVSYYGKSFFEEYYEAGLPNLMESPEKKKGEGGEPKDGKKSDKQLLVERRQEVAKRLALVMLKYPVMAEEGFRLLAGARCWTFAPEELDGYARQALINSKNEFTSGAYSDSRYFVLRRGNGGSSSGDDLAQHASVKWIMTRLGQVKSPDVVLPPAYLEDLKKRDASIGNLVASLASLKSVDQLKKLWQDETISSGQGRVHQMLRLGLIARAATVPGSSAFFLGELARIKPGSTRYGYSEMSKDMLLIQSALLSAGAIVRDSERESLCLAVQKATFGEKVDWEHPADTQALISQVNMIEQILRAGEIEPVAAARLCRTLHRLKIPVGSGEYSVTQHFQRSNLKTAEEAEAYLESLGCLAEVDAWSPMAVWTMRWEGGSRNAKITVKETLLQNRLFGSTDFSSSDLVKRLKERKKGRFGSLICAATLSSSSDRDALVLQAITEAAPVIAKMPEARLGGINLVMTWLKPESIAKLPPNLRSKFKGVDEKRRVEVAKQAEEFLKNKPTVSPGSYYSMRGDVSNLVKQLLPLAPDKALEVFLEAERRYTKALAQGARSSRSNYNGFELSDRDSMLISLFDSSSETPGASADEALKFYQKVQTAPEGGRFSFSPRYEDDNNEAFSRIGGMLVTASAGDKAKAALPEMQRMIEYALSRDAALRADAVIAMVCSKLDSGRYNSVNVAEERKKHEPARAALGANYRYISLRFGLLNWKNDSAEVRKETVDALAAVLGDAAIRTPLKQALAFRAVARVPELLAEPAVFESLASLYESYCADERSAVNGWSGVLFAALARYEAQASALPVVKRFGEAFWKNAQASKPGGHGNIPSSLAGNLMVVAARTGDGATAKRLFSQTQGEMSGNLKVITSMIASGQYDLAKMLLPPRGFLYPVDQQQAGVFTRQLEERLPGFVAFVADPELSIRLETKLLTYGDAEGGDAPKEKKQQRSERLAKSYPECRPKDRVIQAEVLCGLIRNNRFTTIPLADELAAWARDCDYKAGIDQWENAYNSKVNNILRYQYASIENEVYGAAVMASLLRGDPALLEKATEIFGNSPVLEKSSRNSYKGSTQYVLKTCQMDLMDRACFWYWYALANGGTDGFEKALPLFETLALNAEKRFEFEQDELNSGLSICQFLAVWSGHPERFDELKAKMQTRPDMVKKYQSRCGIAPFAYSGARFAPWKNPQFKDMRKVAVEKVFANPKFASLVPWDGGWLEQLSTSVPMEQLCEIALLPDDKLIPEVRPTLFEYRGKKMAGQKKPEEAVTAYRRALSSTPAEPAWNSVRGAVKVPLAELLVADGKKDEAKQLVGGMPAGEVGDWIKSRYKKIAPTLGVPDVTAGKEPPPPPPPPAKEEDE